jgi:class 3 adenylate cyclase
LVKKMPAGCPIIAQIDHRRFPTEMDEAREGAHKCFVPEMLVDFIEKNCENGKEGLEPCSFFIRGVCLLVDISGFTKLSGDYCNLGKEGIDGLQLATNGYMGSLVEIIYSCGGEIIKFAGDAIICVFSSSFTTGISVAEKGKLRRSISTFGGEMGSKSRSGRNTPEPFLSKLASCQMGILTPRADPAGGIPAGTVLRAMRCANLLRDVQTSKLTVHVAMSCGEMCFGILGGVENRWECLISGPCIHELSDCLDDAPSKTAVMTKACADIVLASAVQHFNCTCSYVTGSPKGSPSPKGSCPSPKGGLRSPKGSSPGLRTHCTCSSSHSTVVLTECGQYTLELLRLPSGNHRIELVKFTGSADDQPSFARMQMAHRAGINSRAQQVAQRLIRQFVPVPIAEDIEVGRGLNFIAEIREVTTMFMKVCV